MRGRDFGAWLAAQLKRAGIEPRLDRIVDVTGSQVGFQMTGTHSTYHARSVILATGTDPVWLPIQSAGETRGRVRYDVKGIPEGEGPVAVIGGGEAALDYALSLARFGYDVTVICRGKELRANHALKAAVLANEKIRLETKCEVVRLAEGAEGVILECGDGRRFTDLLVVCAIGRRPSFPRIDLEVPGRPDLNPGCRTDQPGLFVAGDIHRGRDRRISCAVADGATAGAEAIRYLKEVA